jgi:HD-GYP domain-containing protein (c-di-GMP phosphodiesterase class II)
MHLARKGDPLVMNSFRKIDKYRVIRVLAVIGCTLLNVLLNFVMNRLNVPLYLDTVGTIFTAALCGTFPGVLTAVATNFICEIFAADSVYYVFIGILIAVMSSWFTRNERYKSKKNIVLFVGLLALIGGVVGTAFQWLLLGGIQFPFMAETANSVSGSVPVLNYLVSMLFILAINIVDKGIAVVAAFLMIHLIPKETRRKIRTSGWKQAPLALDEIRTINREKRKEGTSIKVRISLMLMAATVLLLVAFMWVSSKLAYESEVSNSMKTAASMASLAAMYVEPDTVDDILESGMTPYDYAMDNKDYATAHNNLRKIIKSFPDAERLTVCRIKADGVYTVFDSDPYFYMGGKLGERHEAEEILRPAMPELLRGGRIEPIRVNTREGSYICLMNPIFDMNGECAAYIGVDVSTAGYSGYVRKLILNMMLMFAGVFALILSYGLKSARTYLIYPIGSLEKSIDGFMQNIGDQDKLDENVKKLQKLDIHTDDELEGLYNSVCEMAVGTSEQMRSIRLLAKKNDNMQAGLIITMADMVENRDSDTGAHILKTAAYVRIILEGLRRKGYYSEKITDKYIKDVEMSAPLHDVGKINVSDTILNKPEKLTDEEYEIMKTHTTAGKKILENAISTVKGENYLKEARNMAAYHHERWDGKGYPEGLHGQVIPLSARVMAVADVFDALASPRVYKPAFPLEKALQIIREGAGTQFDPKCVEVFLDSIADVKKVLRKYQGQDQ